MKTNTRNTKSTQKKKYIIVVAVLVIVLAIAGASYALISRNTPDSSTDTTNTPGSVNYNPPTDQETDSSQDGKKDSTDGNKDDENSNGDTPSQKKTAQVGIANTYKTSNSLEIRAFTPSVVEGTGTCTATLIKGSLSVSKSAEAFIDASTSQCRVITIPLSEFGEKGAWTLTVTYSSPAYAGTSSTWDVQL